MRRVTLPLLGDGSDGNPYRVDLPTYTHVRMDVDAGTMTVLAPDIDFPPIAPFRVAPGRGEQDANVDPSQISVTDLRRWHDWLEARYVDHPARFRPMPVAPALHAP